MKLVLQNNGINPITSLPYTVNISGDINLTLTGTYTGNLAINSFDTIFTSSFNTYQGGIVTINAFVNLANDQNPSNDSINNYNVTYRPFDPITEPAEVCPGQDTITLMAKNFPGVGYNWFD
ncbi:hypothetical protein RZS08_24980, partial [Arthrospira platensis SPKY1]|nr:hypothetical protein [Arthrospira platensis SPKY1]